VRRRYRERLNLAVHKACTARKLESRESAHLSQRDLAQTTTSRSHQSGLFHGYTLDRNLAIGGRGPGGCRLASNVAGTPVAIKFFEDPAMFARSHRLSQAAHIDLLDIQLRMSRDADD
jgi:hypothetical protein